MIDVNKIYEEGGLFDGHYKLIDSLSTAGGSGDVWLAIDVRTLDNPDDESSATKVAIKIYRPKNILDIEGEHQFRREFKTVYNCHHENIIQPTYFSIYEEMPYLVLPYCPAGSSELLIGELKDDKNIWKYIFQVASGLSYLHNHNPRIIHQDIKPSNILIDDNGNYAITDFGISAKLGGNNSFEDDEVGGTFAYMAPERFLEGTPPMPESDIWAFGAALYELLAGDTPYGNDGGLLQKKDAPVPPLKTDVSDDIKQLIYDCLAYDPKNRPSAAAIVERVMKKRYRLRRKTMAVIAACLICVISVAAGLTLYFYNHANSNPDAALNSLVISGDSIVGAQLTAMKLNDDTPLPETIEGLEKAQVLYAKVLHDATDRYAAKDSVAMKISIIDRLVNEIGEYNRAQDLAEKALLTDMPEEYESNSRLAGMHRNNINQLIQQLR